MYIRLVRVASYLFFAFVILSLNVGCDKSIGPISGYPESLQSYVDRSFSLEFDDLIACAGGTSSVFVGDSINPISVFLYPEGNAYDFRYYETDSINLDPNNYRNYHRLNLNLSDVFQGVMKKFDHPPMVDERWGIVTFRAEDKLHMCNPIRLKAIVSPTEDISGLTTITSLGTTPTFDWSAETEPNNVIYFSMVSTMSDSLISGTYTYDKFWTFYDLSNVVLNVTTGENPSLKPLTDYSYKMMGVSIDNWVHTFSSVGFTTQ